MNKSPVFKTKFRFNKNTIVFLLLTIVGVLIFFIFKQNAGNKHFVKSIFGVAVCFSIMFILYLYLGYTVLKIPRIIIDSASIYFNSIFKKEQFPLSTIQKVKLTGKGNIVFEKQESIKIIFVNGVEKILFLNCYSNNRELRIILKRIMNPSVDLEKSLDAEVFNISPPKIIGKEVEIDFSFSKYSGFFLLLTMAFL